MTNTPNWQHHSRKEQKRNLKPQAVRARKAALKALKRKLSPPFRARTRAYNGLCSIRALYTYLISLMFGRKDVNIAVRMAPEEESGRYAIGEIALSTQLMMRNMSPCRRCVPRTI